MNVATDTVASLVASLQSVAGVKGAFHALTEEELMDKAKVLQYPAAGVIYEGMRGGGDSGKATHRVGLSADLTVSLVILYNSKAVLGQTAMDALKLEALELLDLIRNTIRDTRGPSQHFWRFISEAPALEKNGVVLYIQRWSLPVKLSQGL